MFAGAYLTMSTAVGIIGADVIAGQFSALARFTFTIIFAIGLILCPRFQWGAGDLQHALSDNWGLL